VTPEQRLLVQISLDKVRACTPSPVALFYERLFELDPALRPLFRCDLEAQERRMLDSLGNLVDALDDPESFQSKLWALGRRHVGYGVENRHYETVGAALLWAMEQSLGATFTPEVRAAWTELYRTISIEMQAAAALP
jgi:hemoglobin-like flavoprotein